MKNGAFSLVKSPAIKIVFGTIFLIHNTTSSSTDSTYRPDDAKNTTATVWHWMQLGAHTYSNFVMGTGKSSAKSVNQATAERNKHPFAIHYFRYFIEAHDRDKVKKE
jgi:hypothetical protein